MYERMAIEDHPAAGHRLVLDGFSFAYPRLIGPQLMERDGPTDRMHWKEQTGNERLGLAESEPSQLSFNRHGTIASCFDNLREEPTVAFQHRTVIREEFFTGH